MTDPGDPHKNSEPHKNDEPSKDLDEELIAMLRHLRLGRLLSHWDETVAKAKGTLLGGAAAEVRAGGRVPRQT